MNNQINNIRATVDGKELVVKSLAELLELERNAFAEALQIQYNFKRVVKHISMLKLDEEDAGELEALTNNPSFRIALTACCTLHPDQDVYCINDNYFVRLVGNYWAVIGEQTRWSESDVIKM